MAGNPLKGLLSHYMDSDEEETGSAIVAATMDPTSSSSSGAQKSTHNATSNDINNEVEDFLKEIDAISSVPGSSGTKENHVMANGTPNEVSSVSQSSERTSDSVLTAEEPRSLWLECYDNTSGYLYFWHTVNNTVTWECPEEYKQDRAKIALWQQKHTAADNAHTSSKDFKGLTAKPSGVHQQQQNRVIPIANYGDGSSSEDEDDKMAVEDAYVSSRAQLPVPSTTPEESLPSIKSTGESNTVYGPSLPPPPPPPPISPGDGNVKSPKTLEEEQGPSSETLSSTSSSSKVSWVLAASATVSDEPQEPDSTSSFSAGIAAEFQPCNRPTSCQSPSVMKDSAFATESDSQMRSFSGPQTLWTMDHLSTTLQYNPDNSGSGAPLHPGFGFGDPLRLSSSSSKLGNSKTSVGGVSFVKAETLDLNEVNRQEVSKYSDIKSSRSSDSDANVQQQQSPGSSNSKDVENINDIDEIERELDLALERKSNKNSEVEVIDSEASSKKRKSFTPSMNSFGKRPKSDNDNTRDAALSAIVMDKLKHLGATLTALSQLQLLYIEIQTRKTDWERGALAPEYYMQQLQSANEKLTSLEIGSLPVGWTCQWDRIRKGYLYQNSETGHQQWNRPVSTTSGEGITWRRSSSEGSSQISTSYSVVSSTTNRLQEISFHQSTAQRSKSPPPLPRAAAVVSASVPPPLPPSSPKPPPPLPPLESPQPPPPPPIDDTVEKEPNDTASADFSGAHRCPATATCPPVEVPSPFVLPDHRQQLLAAASSVFISSIPVSVDTLQSELDSFYMNLAASEGPASSTSNNIETESSEPVRTTPDPPANLVPIASSVATTSSSSSSVHPSKRKIKKTKIATGLVLKKKNMPSLVEKWQRIQQEQFATDEMGTSGLNDD